MKNKCCFLLFSALLALSFSACSNNLREKGNRYDEQKANDSIEQRTPTTTPAGGAAGGAGQSMTDTSGGAPAGDSGSSGADSTGS